MVDALSISYYSNIIAITTTDSNTNTTVSSRYFALYVVKNNL